jgi:hypothetical protein
MLTNAYLTNTPQREVVADQLIKPDQLLNLAPAAPILVKSANVIRELQVPFAGDAMLRIMQYFEGEAEIRTGVGRNTAGLDPDILQNQSATANANMVSAMQGRIEQIARVWAQGGMRKLFRGILKCLIAYQDFPRTVQVRGQMQTVDPQQWQGLDELDININTGLGTGNQTQEVGILKAISDDQIAMMPRLGPGNPVVNMQKIVRTKQMMCEAAGINNPESFYGDAKNPDGTPWEPPPPQPPGPSPDAVVLAQTEKEKIASDERKKMMELQERQAEAAAKIASDERIAYRQQDIDLALRLEELGIKKAETLVKAADVDAKRVIADMKSANAA